MSSKKVKKVLVEWKSICRFASSLTNKTNIMKTKLELLDEIYQDIMDDYIPTPEVIDALESIRELAKKLEQI